MLPLRYWQSGQKGHKLPYLSIAISIIYIVVVDAGGETAYIYHDVDEGESPMKVKVVTTPDQVLDNIARLQTELKQSPDLVGRLGFVHAWYADTRDPEHPLFGFSKFAGYQDLSAETYLCDYKELDGRNTEWVLKDFFEELRLGTPDFKRYHEELTNWLGSLGRTPRKKVRLMVLKPEFREKASAEDRRLLDLLTAVADMLPINHRHELRSRL